MPEIRDNFSNCLLNLSALQLRNTQWRARYELLDNQVAELEGQRDTWKERAELQGEVLAVLQRLEETWRGHYEQAIAALGGQGINSVFADHEYEVLLETSIKRGVWRHLMSRSRCCLLRIGRHYASSYER